MAGGELLKPTLHVEVRLKSAPASSQHSHGVRETVYHCHEIALTGYTDMQCRSSTTYRGLRCS